MKKILFLFALPLFIACQRDPATEVSLRLTDIYEDVLGHYRTALRKGANPDAARFQEKYYSSRFLQATAEAAAGGEIIDADPWIQGQDWPPCIHTTTDSVREVTPDSVVASVTIYNFQPVPVHVIMVRERGDWFIDAFLPVAE